MEDVTRVLIMMLYFLIYIKCCCMKILATSRAKKYLEWTLKAPVFLAGEPRGGQKTKELRINISTEDDFIDRIQSTSKTVLTPKEKRNIMRNNVVQDLFIKKKDIYLCTTCD